MNRTTFFVLFLAAGSLVLALAGAEPPPTGPATEKRFPPLKVPSGFKATLFACDPFIEYPSVIALGPKPRSLFVAADYVTGLGVEIIRHDEIRLIEDTDGDGYADKSTLFASGFNSIQGLAYHDGTVFLMHAPFLTALRDTDGDGKADERHDLLTGLGLTPEKNPTRLHCANGVVPGHDGWLYLALGDNGCDVPRPEGDRLILHGGGILRCRPDGRDLHVFARGLRNIYDVALDDDSNVFVRDNENDGGTYMNRLYHSFHGADHGYPYLYEEHPQEALLPLAELGLGSSAGGVCYLETAFPTEYRGNLFFCEWGRSVQRSVPQRSGSSFAPLKEMEFAAGAEDDPYGFKPTDLVVGRDGALFISDWADGQRPKRGRGRIYRVAPVGEKASSQLPRQNDGASLLKQLDATSYQKRVEAQIALQRDPKNLEIVREALRKQTLAMHGRLHAVWLLARPGSAAAVLELFDLAKSDPEPRVQAQALRAIGDLADPILTQHRIDAGPRDAGLAAQLAQFALSRDPLVLRETLICLGRMQWADAPNWLPKALVKPDPALLHAAQQMLRRSGNWLAVLKLLDHEQPPLRQLALRALAEEAEPQIADGLIERLRKSHDPQRQRAYADALTRIYKKPGPWTYWGYRPPPRPPNLVAWEKTEAIARALNDLLVDGTGSSRLIVLRRMLREKIPTRLPTLQAWLSDERQAESVTTLLEALREHPAQEVRPTLAALIRDQRHTIVNREAALAQLTDRLDAVSTKELLVLAENVEDGAVLADLLRRCGQRLKQAAKPLLLRRVASANAAVRAAALEALTDLPADEVRDLANKLLTDKDAHVRCAAATAVGKLQVRSSVEALLKMTRDDDGTVRRASLDTLRLLREPKALPSAVLALNDRQTDVQALALLGELGGPEQAPAVAALVRSNPAMEVQTQVLRTLTTWRDKPGIAVAQRHEMESALAEVQGFTGVFLAWQGTGPLDKKEALSVVEELGKTADVPASWRALVAKGAESAVPLGISKEGDAVWLACTDFSLTEKTTVQFLGTSQGSMRIWLDGKSVYQHADKQAYQLDGSRFTLTIEKGRHRLLIQVGNGKEAASFHLRLRRRSSRAEHEQLTQAALTRRGDPEHGRKLFFDVEKTLCLKCHRLGDQGEKIGPELTGVGARFARAYIVESILEPSRTIAPSFQTVMVALNDGRLLSGIPIAETDKLLTLADNQGQKQVLAKSIIEERRPHPLSTMPEGLEKRLTVDEFVDLIAFLTSRKEKQ